MGRRRRRRRGNEVYTGARKMRMMIMKCRRRWKR